ncbi:cyclic nucleotide-binding domain-containing protein [Taklimakanibacter deserti]|uniref:cyclic nucleotide-binding domain-containing protein n=1 Tax=Taklimakanibacter deserti TaxID=2267839 RepID=UPI000E649E17
MSNCSERKGLSASGLELFAGVPAGIVAHIEEQCTWHRFDAHEFVIENQSKRSYGVFFLVEGEVEIFKPISNRECMSLVKLSAPDCFGEFGAVSREMGSASVRTLTPCVIAEISSERFLSLLNACPAASLYLFKKVVSLIKNLGEESIHHHSAHHALETAHRNAVLRSP